MFRAIDPTVLQQDWRLLTLAGLVCVLSGLSATQLYRSARTARGSPAAGVIASGAAAGVGVWSIQLIAVLVFQRGINDAHSFPSILFWLVSGIASTTLGAVLASSLYRLRVRHIERQRQAFAQRSEAQLRERNRQLDAALNNMSQALCMFDAEKRLIVCNQQYAEVFGLPPELTKPGTPVLDILNYRVARGIFPGDDPESYIQSRLAIVEREAPTKTFTELPDGRIFSVLHVPMIGGGWVATHEDVTEQFKAQRALKAAQDTLVEATASAERAAAETQAAHQRLLEASNLMSAGFVLFDADDRFVLWNKRYAELCGVSEDSIEVGVRFEDALRAWQTDQYGDQAQREQWLCERLARHRRAENTEEIRLADDRWIRIDERRTADGGSIGVRVDITELKHKESSFWFLFENNPVPMWLYDHETMRFLAVNDAAVSHYGYSRERFLEMSIFDIRPPDEAEKLRQHLSGERRIRQDGEIWRHAKATGEPIDVAIYERIMTYAGRPAALIAAIDMTKTKRAEAEAQQTREFFNTVLENVPAPILVKDAHSFQLVLVNRAAEAFLGAPRASLINKTSSQIYSGGEGNFLSELDREALEHKREVYSDEYRVDTPGNGVRFVTSKRLPILDESGEPAYLITVINDITERKRANERIAHLSTHDALTGLANREAFQRQLADALAHGDQRGVAALRVDLDRFKDINDVYGYAIGDAVLRAVAHRLKRAAGGAFVARVGGDEFTFIVAGDQPVSASAAAERIFAALADEIEAENLRLKISLSIGVAIWPTDGADPATLLANAEAALDRAKEDGRGIVRFFEPAMDAKLRDRRSMEHDLQTAIAQGQLRVHYQPQADIAGEIFGFEALARWRHPTRGQVPPSVFIPLAEESGAIKEIGEWILREACREAASWPRPLTVSVNLSPMQFRQGDLIAMIQNILVETGLSGRRLELEITESALIGDPDSARAILRRIKSLGVRIAMDDFGTGYSSLSYLQSFPFDKIKIDRSFVAGLDGNAQAGAIIRAVIGLAHGLHLPVIAEGVETKDQVAFLKREGCDEMQGYLVGRPEPIENYASDVGRSGGQGLKVVA
jgi:diguanylate cyclase (GGDEF)-like protein/PAS domain S-box-containing protein